MPVTRSIVLLVALLSTVLASPASAQLRETSGDQATRHVRVVGGSAVAEGALPWVVALVDASRPDASTGRFCTGTVIHPSVVLTAAHCVTDELGTPDRGADTIDVVAGAGDLATGVRLRARQVLVHPDWLGGVGSPGDAALLDLQQPTTAPPVPLITPAGSAAIPVGDPALVAGYGAVDAGRGVFVSGLQAADVPLVGDAGCAVYGGEFLPGVHRCAGGQDGIGACAGDSGGPLLHLDAAGRYAQVGVTSWGANVCGTLARPDVYTDVAYLSGWIAATVALLYPPPPPVVPVLTPSPPVAAPAVTPASATSPPSAAPETEPTVRIEGFRVAAPRAGAAVPRPAVRAGGRLVRCAQLAALTVVFSYADLQPGDKIRARWFRNGLGYFTGEAIAPGRASGRSFRTLGAGARNGRFRADLYVGQRLVARGRVKTICP